MKWEFEQSGFCTGEYNMRRDESLAGSLISGEGLPTLRLFGWNPPAISLGWNQSPEEIMIDEAAAAGVQVVRRPTGGRAVLHSEELTYSVVMMAHGRRVMEVYDEISRALIEGLRILGIDAVLEKSQPHFPSLYARTSSPVCFTSSARYEIKVGGKKLVGSAQRRYSCGDGAEVVLQHGSILLGADHRRIARFLSIGEAEKTQMERELREGTTDVRSVLGRNVTFNEVAPAVREGFEKVWGIEFEGAAVGSQDLSEVIDQ